MKLLHHEPTIGHTREVTTVAYSPDNKKFISGSSDNTVRVWDLESRKCIAIFEGHSSSVLSISVSQDAKRIISGSDDHRILVWDLDKSNIITKLEGHSDSVLSVSLSTDGKVAISGSSDKTVRVWNLDRYHPVIILEGHSNSVLCVSISQDSKLAVSGSSDNTINIWDLENNVLISRLAGHSSPVLSISISHDNKYLISGSSDSTIKIWDLKNKTCISTLFGHSNSVLSVSISADGNRAISGSSDKTIRIWDLVKNDCIEKLTIQQNYISSVYISKYNEYLYSTSDHNKVILWNLENKRNLLTLHQNCVSFLSSSISQEGNIAILGSSDKTVQIWNFEKQQCISTLVGHSNSILSVSISQNSKRAISGSSDNTLRIWDTEDNSCIKTLKGHSNSVLSVSISQDGKRAVSGSSDNTVRLWDLENNKRITTLKGHSSSVFSVSLSQDGKRAVSGSFDNTVRLWDLKNNKCIAILKGHSNSVLSVSISQDGKRAVSGSDDNTVRVWDLENNKCIAILEGHYRSVITVSISNNGKYAVSTSDDNTVRVWDLEIFYCISIWEEKSNSITSLSFSGDGNRIFFSTLSGDMFYYALDNPIKISKSPKYVSAKLILIGESGVGKTGLGWRLAHKEYKDHSSTHGQQFWLIKDLQTTRLDGTVCEAILWDFAGQPDYRLTHSLFLDNTTVAILLFDPTDTTEPLRGLDYWLRTLRCGSTKDCKTILVAARSDRGTGALTSTELEKYCEQRQIEGKFLYTSAKENENIDELLERVKVLIPWETFAPTVTTATFKQIKDLTLRRKEVVTNENLLIIPEALQAELRATDPELTFTSDEFKTAIGHLADHGYLYRLITADGEPRLLLTPERLNNLAASFILKARNHPDGLGALEDEKIYQNTYDFPELRNLPEETKEILLATVVRLFLDRQVAFRETQGNIRVLVFPELINIKRPQLEDSETEEGVSYSVSGPIENLYASLVVRLGYSNLFEKKHCWYNNAQYEAKDKTICGFRQIADHEGEREFVLFFTKDSQSPERRVFESFFESLLDPTRLEIERFPLVVCTKCHERQTRQSIINRIRQQKDFVFCSECGERISITLAPSLTLNAKEKQHMEEARRTAAAHTRYESARAGLEQAYGPTPSNITTFISYAWGVTEHEDWVERKLADHLKDAGFDVLLDRWENSAAGKGVARFIERIPKSDFVIIVGTPKYLEKYEKKLISTGTVVSTEIELINTIFIYNSEETASKILPLILAGDKNTSLPPLLRGRVYYEFQKPETYHTRLFDLLLTLRGLSFSDKAVRALRDTLAERKP